MVEPAKWLNPKDFGPVLGAVVWAMNEWQYQVGGLKPILNPRSWASTTVAPGSAGTLGAYGPFGNPLTFSVTTQPVNGTVTVSTDGTWVYTADPGYGTVGSTDSFAVTATDSAFHLENLFGRPGHQSTVTVPVTVDSKSPDAGLGLSTTYMYVNNFSAGALQIAGYLTNQTEQRAGWTQPVGTVLNINQTAQWLLPQYNNHIDVLLNPYGVYHEGILDNYSVGSNPFGVVTVNNSVGSDTNTKVYVTNYSGGGVTVINPDYCQVCGPLNPSPGGYNTKFIPTGLNPNAVAFNGNRQLVYVTNSGSGTVSQIYTGDDNNPAGVIKTIDVGAGPVGVAIGPGGNKVYVTNSGSNSVSEIDNNTGAVLNTINLGAKGSNPFGVAVSGDGRVWVANSGSNTVAVIDTNGAVPQVTDLITVGGTPIGVAVNGRDGNIWVAAETGMVSVINPNTNSVVANIPVVKPQNIVISPDGAYAYVTNAGLSTNTMTTIDTATQAIVNVVSTGGSDAQGIAVDASGYQVYVASSGSNTVAEIGVGLAGQTGDGGTAYYTVSAYSDNSGFHMSCTASRGMSCDTGTPYANANLFTAPGTVVTVTGSYNQDQVLSNYCNDTVSNCTWQTTGSVVGYNKAKNVSGWTNFNNSNPVYNPDTGNAENPTTVTYTVSSTVAIANAWATTLGFSQELKYKSDFLVASAEATIKANEQETQTHTYTSTDTTSQSNAIPVYPQTTQYMFYVSPVYRYVGTWTVYSNGVTYLLPNVWLDTPFAEGTTQYITFPCSNSDAQCKSEADYGNLPASQFPNGYDPNNTLTTTDTSNTENQQAS